MGAGGDDHGGAGDGRDEVAVDMQQFEQWQQRTAKRNEDCGMELVEDEVIEHAFLDFMKMELGLEIVLLEPGTLFTEDEEIKAHAELDSILDCVHRGSQDDMEIGDQDDTGGYSSHSNIHNSNNSNIRIHLGDILVFE